MLQACALNQVQAPRSNQISVDGRYILSQQYNAGSGSRDLAISSLRSYSTTLCGGHEYELIEEGGLISTYNVQPDRIFWEIQCLLED